MNPRRRMGMGLLAVGILGIVGALVLVAGYTARVEAKVGNLVPVLVLTEDVVPYEPVTEDMVRVEQVPERYAPLARIHAVSDAAGKVPTTRLQEGSFLQEGMLVYAPTVGPRQRKITVAVGADSVAAGDVRPGDEVAIYGAFTMNNPNRSRCLALLVPAARVDRVGSSERRLASDTVPISVVVNNSYTRRLLFAASFGEEIRIVALGPGAPTEWPKSDGCGPGRAARPQEAQQRRNGEGSEPRRASPRRSRSRSGANR